MPSGVLRSGTDSQRILILQCQRTDGLDSSLLAVDPHMRVRFASYEVALLLGYSMRQLVTMKLDQLLPQPFNALHAKWIRVGLELWCVQGCVWVLILGWLQGK